MKARMRRFWQRQEGVVAPLFAILLVFGIIVGILALVLDLGHMHNVRSELQKAADACALRGARAFYPDVLPAEPEGLIKPDPVNAQTQAIQTIDRNMSDFIKLTDLPANDVEVGVWDFEQGEWVPGTTTVTPPTGEWSAWDISKLYGKPVGPGVGVIIRREGSLNKGPVRTTLASGPPMNVDPMTVRAGAVAALSGVGAFTAGIGTFPIALNVDLIHPDKNGNYTITLTPDQIDWGGWTSLTENSPNAALIKRLINRTEPTPEVKVGDEIGLQNGVACSAIKEFIDYYHNNMKVVEGYNGVYDVNPPVKVWFPGVKEPKFNQCGTVVGGFLADIIRVYDANSNYPDPNEDKKTVKCTITIKIKQGAAPLPGGGIFLGLISTEPKLTR